MSNQIIGKFDLTIYGNFIEDIDCSLHLIAHLTIKIDIKKVFLF